MFLCADVAAVFSMLYGSFRVVPFFFCFFVFVEEKKNSLLLELMSRECEPMIRVVVDPSVLKQGGELCTHLF